MRWDLDPTVENLIQAVGRGDVRAVIGFLDAGVDVNLADEISATALMYAVHYGHIDVMRVFLERGASLSPQSSVGHSALTVALIRAYPWAEMSRRVQADPRPLALLLAAGARYGLREAVMLNDLELARARLDEGADPNTGKFKYNGPLLKIAAEQGYRAMVELLLDRGAEIEATDDLGRRPLLSAACYGRLDVVRFLLDRGADIDGDDWCDHTALSEAALHGHRHVVEFLLSQGAKRTLHDAVNLDDLALAKVLLPPKSDADEPGLGYSWLVTHAIGLGNQSMVQLLLDHGASPDPTWLDENGLLLDAVSNGHVDIVKLLIDRGANVNAVGHDGKTALAWAIERRYQAVVECLTEAGALTDCAQPKSEPPTP